MCIFGHFLLKVPSGLLRELGLLSLQPLCVLALQLLLFCLLLLLAPLLLLDLLLQLSLQLIQWLRWWRHPVSSPAHRRGYLVSIPIEHCSTGTTPVAVPSVHACMH